ncbi:MAG: putative transcriptional regulator, Crp/Fnr family [Bacteroidetes bacterium]|jgi:CRP-like cAMP-binding protein|nr:putative transcriptional regulator, Crp/Fnr family [Bacteroidota bacterium]
MNGKNHDNDHSLLKTSIAAHAHLSESEFFRFVSLAVIRKYKKGQFLIPEGSTTRKTHFMRKGAAIAYFIDSSGDEHVIQFGIEGWWISDLQSFINGGPARLNVRAIEDCEIYEFSREHMDLAYDEIPGIVRYFLRITQNAFATFQSRVLADMSLPAEERYKIFCSKYPQIELRFSQKLIASYIGITPESLSRIKKSLLER